MPPRKRRRTTESCRPLGLGTLVVAFDGFRVRQTGDSELRVEKDGKIWSLASQGLASAPPEMAALVNKEHGGRTMEAHTKVLCATGATSPTPIAVVLRGVSGALVGAAIARDVQGAVGADGPDSSLVVAYHCGDLPPLLAGLVALGRAFNKAAVVWRAARPRRPSARATCRSRGYRPA